MRYIVKIISAMLIAIALIYTPVKAEDAPPEISATSYVLIDTNSGKVLYEKDATNVLPVAGVARYLSLIASYDTKTSEVTYKDEGYSYSNALGLANETSYNIDDLRYALLLSNKEDASVALSELAKDPLTKLQSKAKEIGMVSTTIQDTYSQESISTAIDIAVLARAVAKNEEAKIIYGSTTYTPTTLPDNTPLTRELMSYEGIVGEIDTASDAAKIMTVATVNRDGTSFTAVVIGEPSKDIAQKDLTILFNNAYSNYQNITITSTSITPYTKDIYYKGSIYHTTFSLNNDLNLLMSKKIDPNTITTDYAFDNENDPNTIKGYLVILQDGKEVGRVELTQTHQIEDVSAKSKLNYFDYFSMGLAIIFVAVFILKYMTLFIQPKE